MSVALGRAEFLLLHPIPSPAIPSRHHRRPWKRRRLKPLTLHNQLDLPPSSPFEHLFHSLLSQFPSPNTLTFIAPTLGFASGLALYLSSNSQKLFRNPNPNEDDFDFDVGEWILFASPTPFNRFVTLRCPSICFPGNESLEDVNEKLVKEDKHYVKLKGGRIIEELKSGGGFGRSIIYQRICVSTEDGGVLSFDWPANLELEEERGFDTTVLIVPGTAEGSNEEKIKLFVLECLRRGLFPVVMNPRGCAGSPLTTARLFTAADSDDISTAIQFINKKRPWTTLMGVGWGYGANMLTKYLAEVGEKTPLTAATCIDNPFDLEEAAKFSVDHMGFDHGHTSGLISILQRNKELFQGRGKGFNVQKAISASSVRDFEESISMLTYGFNKIEDFYAKASTRNMVGKVKIPVLFIQNDDGTIPLFSIPRELIAKNPYTSLLLCCYSPSNKLMSKSMDAIFTLSWYQNLTIEWLLAVELGLLKGRHPLLKDVDFTINPSRGLAVTESQVSSKNGRLDKMLNLTDGRPMYSSLDMFEANDASVKIQSRSSHDRGQPYKTKELEEESNNATNQSSASANAEIVEERTNFLDSERGQVVASAQVVLNMLDLTKPEMLSDEQKQQVLSAVGQGETLIKALQDAVPEDVRGKLTTAVSGILQSEGSDLKFDKLLNLGHIPDLTSGLNSKEQNIRQSKSNGDKDVQSSDQKKMSNDSENGSAEVDNSSDKPTVNVDLQNQTSEELQNQSSDNLNKPYDRGMAQSTSDHGSNSSDPEKVNLQNMQNPVENEQLSKAGESVVENFSEVNAKSELSILPEGPGGTEDIAINQKNAEDQMETNMHEHDSSPKDPNPTTETEVTDNERERNQEEEETQPGPVSSQTTETTTPSFGVSQAFEALTGFDDSTQIAVNSVFNVIEGMIDQLEVKKDNENGKSEAKEIDEAKKLRGVSVSENQLNINHPKSKITESLGDNSIEQSGGSDGGILHDSPGSKDKYKHQGETYDGFDSDSFDIINAKPFGGEKISSVLPAAGELSEGKFFELSDSSSRQDSSYVTNIPYGDPLYGEYLKKILASKMRNFKPPDMHKTSALHLYYIPEEGKWKFLEDQTAHNVVSVNKLKNSEGGHRVDQGDTQSISKHTDDIIEPSYVILDSERAPEKNKEHREINIVDDEIKFNVTKYTPIIKSLILERLNVEVGRRASAADIEELELQFARDVKHVADVVSLTVEHGRLHMDKSGDNLLDKHCTLDGENIIKAISSAVQETKYLGKVLPVGIVVGSTLAALRELFNVVTLDSYNENDLGVEQVDKSRESVTQVSEKESSEQLPKGTDKKAVSTSLSEDWDNVGFEDSKTNGVMVGAVTAALGASALFTLQQTAQTDESSYEPLNEQLNSKEPSKIAEMPDRAQNNIVTSLAEKAMSVASPVVPTKEDGGVDQERLVAMLTELGQRGGVLRLVGKVALLWGGIRGAMSLADKLLSFLRIAERPLFQRILGFLFLVLLLWSPAIVPLLPSLMQSWATTQKPLKIVEFACIAGLYISITIMVTLWGKRIRKYDDPLQQYGLGLASIRQFQNFLMGVTGGVIFVILIHSVKYSLGCVRLCWPTTMFPSSSEPILLIKSYGRMFMLFVQGIVTATAVAVVEELLFRSWLPQEIEADLGYHRGIIISGLVFALSQRSMWGIPGLWLLSVSLAGARQRTQGSLALPIGLRAGILASNFILNTGGFLTCQSNFPIWISGRHPLQPFGGVIGVAFSLVLAIILYPREAFQTRKTTRAITE